MFPVRIQTRKHVLEHGEYMAPTLQHELDPTHQECMYLSALKYLDHDVGIDYLPDASLSSSIRTQNTGMTVQATLDSIYRHGILTLPAHSTTAAQ